ncbi:hypothetical protein KM043_017556 [Ampulex compressa]|nr:hypothetical protein KM043_017556 [Ampulex compressa]
MHGVALCGTESCWITWRILKTRPRHRRLERPFPDPVQAPVKPRQDSRNSALYGRICGQSESQSATRHLSTTATPHGGKD